MRILIATCLLACQLTPAPQNKVCTLIGCLPYTLTIQSADITTSSIFEVSLTVDGQAIEITATRDAGKLTVTANDVPSGKPAHVEVKRDGTLLATKDYTPAVQIAEPNGPGCGTCDTGSDIWLLVSDAQSPMLTAHNGLRASIPTSPPLEPLAWDASLATYAQEWADHLKSETGDCDVRTLGSPHRSSSPYGESIAWFAGGELREASVVVSGWADEVANYDYANNSCRSVCGHYTQLVWRSTQRVGCGVVSCDGAGVEYGHQEIWVCNYDPPGNYVGQKPY